MKIIRVYHHHNFWEDFLAGMYALSVPPETEQEFIDDSEELLADPIELHQAMTNVVYAWPIAARVNLSNISRNRQAWLGQAACSYTHGAPEYLTRQGWHRLMPNEQGIANGIADRVIAIWERGFVGAQTLFE